MSSRPKIFSPALYIPADLPESGDQWSGSLPAWIIEASACVQALDAAGAREVLLQGYAEAYERGDHESMLVARLYDLRHFNHKPGDASFQKVSTGLGRFQHPALQALHEVALAMSFAGQSPEDLISAGAALRRAIALAIRARDVAIDMWVGDATGDFNQLAGHFDAAELAYRFAYRKANCFIPESRAKILLALKLAMINVGRGQVAEARKHLKLVEGQIASEPKRFQNFASWLRLICGDEATLGQVHLDISSDNLLRQELRRRFLRNDLAVTSADIAGTVDLIEAARLDPLTRLPTGAAIRSLLHRALSLQRRPSLLLVEIADFAAIASMLGEKQSDRLVMAVSRRLDLVLGKECTIGRVGFARFAAVTFKDMTAIDAAIASARQSLAQPYGSEQHKLHLDAHFVVAQAQDSDTSYDLWARSISSLSKRRDEGQGAMYIEASPSPAQTRSFQMVQALHQGGPGNVLHCEFQPIVDARTGRMAACEALARWDSAGFGVVSPCEFISLIDQAGLAIPLGRRLARETIIQGARFCQMDPKLKVHFNMSVAEFAAPDTPEFLQKCLAELGMPAASFGLELTESAFLDTSQSAIQRIEDLNKRGIACILDDFGTGYSNLSYIADLPGVDLKIDGSFIRKARQSRPAAMVCLMLIQLAKALNISVIAEQVETLDQARWLNGLGCYLHQGWYYAKAVPAAELEVLINRPPLHWKTAGGLIAEDPVISLDKVFAEA